MGRIGGVAIAKVLTRQIAMPLFLMGAIIQPGFAQESPPIEADNTSPQSPLTNPELAPIKIFPYPVQLLPGQEKCLILPEQTEPNNPNAGFFATPQEDHASTIWKPQEKWVWQQLCKGNSADLRVYLNGQLSQIQKDLKKTDISFQHPIDQIDQPVQLQTLIQVLTGQDGRTPESIPPLNDLKLTLTELDIDIDKSLQALIDEEIEAIASSEVNPVCLASKSNDCSHWLWSRASLSTDFLRTILLREPFHSALPEKIEIQFAVFPETVDLSSIQLDKELHLKYSLFNQTVKLYKASFARSVYFDNSIFQIKGLELNNAILEGSLFLRDITVIQKNCDTDANLCPGSFNFKGIRIFEDLQINQSLGTQKLNLENANIKNLIIAAQLPSDRNSDQANKHSLFNPFVQPLDLNLNDAQVTNFQVRFPDYRWQMVSDPDLVLDLPPDERKNLIVLAENESGNGTTYQPFIFDSAGHSLLPQSESSFIPTNLLRQKLQEASTSETSTSETSDNPGQSDKNTLAAAIIKELATSSPSQETPICQLQLDGFNYQKANNEGFDLITHCLESQFSDLKNQDPNSLLQPFEQAAKTARDLGQYPLERKFLYNRKRLDLEIAKKDSLLQAITLFISDGLYGFGYKRERSLLWFFGIWVIGAWAAYEQIAQKQKTLLQNSLYLRKHRILDEAIEDEQGSSQENFVGNVDFRSIRRYIDDIDTVIFTSDQPKENSNETSPTAVNLTPTGQNPPPTLNRDHLTAYISFKERDYLEQLLDQTQSKTSKAVPIKPSSSPASNHQPEGNFIRVSFHTPHADLAPNQTQSQSQSSQASNPVRPQTDIGQKAPDPILIKNVKHLLKTLEVRNSEHTKLGLIEDLFPHSGQWLIFTESTHAEAHRLFNLDKESTYIISQPQDGESGVRWSKRFMFLLLLSPLPFWLLPGVNVLIMSGLLLTVASIEGLFFWLAFSEWERQHLILAYVFSFDALLPIIELDTNLQTFVFEDAKGLTRLYFLTQKIMAAVLASILLPIFFLTGV